jgi:hypothetical protein
MKIVSYDIDRIPLELKAVTTYPLYWSDSDLPALCRKYRGDDDRYRTGIDFRGNSDSGPNLEVWLLCWSDGIDHRSDAPRDLEAAESRLAGYTPAEHPASDDRARVYQLVQNFNSARCSP